jgi:hypothetical protein
LQNPESWRVPQPVAFCLVKKESLRLQARDLSRGLNRA